VWLMLGVVGGETFGNHESCSEVECEIVNQGWN
jgi:hypothetical protein